MRVGDYDAYEEVARTATTAVWRIRDARSPESDVEGAGRVAKVLRPAVFWEAEETARRAREFVDRARIQEKIAAGAEHWAPIHDKGGTDEGAFYVTDYFPSTADELIRKKVGIAAPELYRIIGEVISGLEELKEAGARSHGDLMPTNVLLTADNHEEASVRLTDPASDRAAADSGEAGDCHAVGKLIFALVMQRMPRQGEGPPQKATGGWSGLGRRGRRWRDLCARLLQPQATDGGVTTLEQLRAQWKRCAPETVSTKRLAVATVAAVVLVGGVVFGGIYIFFVEPFDQKSWETVYQESQDWFGRFVSDVRRERGHDAIVAQFPALNQVFDDIRSNPKLTAEEIAGGNPGASKSAPPDSVKKREAILQTQKAVLVLTRVKQRLDTWRARVRARVPARFVAINGPPRELAKSIEDFESTSERNPGGSGRVNLVDAIVSVVRYEKWIDPLTALDAAAAEVEKASTPAAGGRADPALAGFGGFTVEWVNKWSIETTGYEKVAELAEWGQKVATKLRSPTLDWEKFANDPWRGSMPQMGIERLDQWLKAADGYEPIASADDPRTENSQVMVAHWETPEDASKPRRTVRFSELLSELSKDQELAKENDPEGVAPLAAGLAKLQSEHAELARWRTLQKDKDALRERVVALLDSGVKERGKLWELTQTDKENVKQQFKQKWDAVATIVPDSPAINHAWVANRDALINARGTVRRKGPKLEELRKYLVGLNGAFAAPLEVPEAAGRGWMDALKARAAARRNEGLGTLLRSFRWAGEAPVPEFSSQRTAAETALSEWFKRAAEAARACAAMEDALDGYYLPGEAPGGGRPSIKDSFAALGRVTDADIVDALKAPAGRAKGVIDFVSAATADRTRARREVEAGQTADEALDYYLAAVRLVDDTVPPNVTRTAVDKGAAELAERAKARTAAADKQRLAALAGQLKANWVTRAVGQVNAPPPPAAHEVIAGADALAAGPAGEIAPGLRDEGKFNLSMFRLISAVNRKDEERTKILFAEVEGLAQRLQIRPTNDNELGRAMIALAEGKKKTGTPADEQGPARAAAARAKWQVQELADRVVYTLLDDTAGRARGAKLTFVDVGKGSYVCTTELPVSVLLYVLKENSGLAPALKDLDTRLVASGPGVYEARTWVMGGQSAEMSTQFWYPLSTERKPRFKSGSQGTSTPAPEHPVNYVSLPLARRVAAKLGCYLPTVEEWNAALAKEDVGGTAPIWNVRDADTWNSQDPILFPADGLQNYSAVQRANAKDVAWGKAGGKLAAGGRDYDDGYLWFAPTDWGPAEKNPVGRGKFFTHLIGNVAEFVETDAKNRPAIDLLADDRNANSAQPPAGTRFVLLMGHSALSAPKDDFTKPEQVGVGPARFGFPDVGVRLAMPNPGPRTFERLASAKLTDLKPYFVRQ